MTNAASTKPCSFIDERHYILTRNPDRPWPAGEREQLTATIRRSWSHDAIDLPRYAGQVRSNRLRVEIPIEDHRKLKHRSRAGDRNPIERQLCAIDETATFDAVNDKVKFGSDYIEVWNEHLQRQGLGTLLFNAMIAWAYVYHPTLRVAPLLVTNHDPKTGPEPFYEVFGFKFRGDRSSELPVSELSLGSVSRRFQSLSPNMKL